MNIRSKWLRFLIAGFMLGAVCISNGCAESDSGESLEEFDGGSPDDIGAGGVDAP
ncbi:MAG: hypothetical protein AB8G99_02335 [Planctomycetaceae bacterium]